MEKRLSRIILITAGVVIGLSVFVILAMLFYSPADYLERYDALAREQGLRFSVASTFFRSVGISAYVGWLIILVWAVVVFFRESLGKVAVRAGSLAVVVISGAALADLLGSSHLGGDVGRALGSVIQASLGTGVGVVLMGSIFTVSLVLATDRGFIPIYRAARDALATAEISPPETPEEPEPPDYEALDLAARIDETARAVVDAEEGPAVEEEPPAEEIEDEAPPEPETEAERGAESSPDAEEETRRAGIHIPLSSLLRTPIAEEELDEDLLTDEEQEPEAEAPPAPVEVKGEEGEPEGETGFGEAPSRDEADLESAPASEPPPGTAPESTPPRSGEDALAAVFDALIGPGPTASEPPPPPPVVDRGFTFIDDEIVLDGAAPESGIDEAEVEEAPAEEPEATAGDREEPSEEEEASPGIVLIDEEISLDDSPIEKPPAPEPVPAEEPEAPPMAEAPSAPVAEDDLLPFMEEKEEREEKEEIPVLEDLSRKGKPGVLRALFGRKATRETPAPARDPLLDEAAELVIERGRASVVLLQRRLDIGYTRASRLVDALEREAVVGPLLPSGSREVLITAEEWDEKREALS